MSDERYARQEETEVSATEMSRAQALTREMAETVARAASDMFGRDVTIIDMREQVSYTDYFVVTSAETARQTRRIAEEIIEKMIEAGHRPRSKRLDDGEWISLDFLDVVVHVFSDEARDYYRLESLWRSAPQESWESGL